MAAAAVETFAEKGFHASTTRDIAQAAGMSHAALYVHYPSKEELLYSISKRGHEAILGIVRSTLDGDGSPTDRMGVFVREFVVHHAREHTRARIINYEMGALRAEHREEIASIRRDIEHRIEEAIEDGCHAGEFDAIDPKMMTRAIISLGIDVSRWYVDGGRWGADTIADQYSAAALRMLGSSFGATRITPGL